MKKVLILLFIITSLMIFSTTTIRVISSDDFAAFRQEAIKRFEELYPDIKVELLSVGYNQLYQKIITTLAVDPSAFDVIDVDCIWTPEFATLGLLEPVDNRLTEDMKNNILESAMNIMRYNGKTYGLPMFNDALFFYYNEDLLKKAGIRRPPATWDEFVAFSKILQDKGLVKYGSVWGWAQAEGLICYYTLLLGSFGGQYFDENENPVFNTGGGLKALEWMVDSIYNYKVVDPSSINSDDRAMLHAIANGDAAFGFNWSFAWQIFNDPDQSSQVDKIKVALVPTGVPGIVSNTSSGSMGLAITKGSKNKEAAWKFISFLASREEQRRQSIEYGAMPIWEDLYNDKEILTHHPEFSEMVNQLYYVTDRPSLVKYQEFSRILQIYIQKALTRQMTPKEALDKAAEEVNKLLGK
ncbi:MAG: ABC transporter substrate-binding protein [Thermosipho sp. (in: Bacteria)]|nr:ABC transporter substrate-binding protein [Thermosipho sp. (in: thermotogales)]